MTVFEKIQSKDINELAKWLDKYGMYDNSPWINWWDRKYCHKCEAVLDGEYECSWCELNRKCRHFPDMDRVPNSEQVIKMWLNSEG